MNKSKESKRVCTNLYCPMLKNSHDGLINCHCYICCNRHNSDRTFISQHDEKTQKGKTNEQTYC